MNASTDTSVQSKAKAHNLHTVGVGFINRLRLVPVNRGKPYWCVSIAALYGVADENGKSETSYFDLRVVASKAIESVELLKPAFDANKTIYVEFKAGDTRAEVFQYKQGERAGQWGASLKGTLLQLRRAWVDGDLVVDTTKPTAEESEAAPSGAESASTNDGNSVEGSGPAESEAQTPTWQERLKDFPERLVIEKSDPEFLDKVLAISNLGRYEPVQAKRQDCVAFKLIQPAEEAA